MSYRYHVYSITKTFANKIQNCKNENEFLTVIQEFFPNKYNDKRDNIIEFGDSFPLYEFCPEIFDFGKDFEIEKLVNKSVPLFNSKELNDIYEEYKPILISKDGFIECIETFKSKIIENYKELLNEAISLHKTDNCDLSNIICHFNSYLKRWENDIIPGITAYNLDEDTNNIVYSPLYEHEIFELVRIYKTFDWENMYMLFLGW